MTRKAVVLLSGGLDSATLSWWLAQQGVHVTAVFVDYGQVPAPGEERAAKFISAAGGFELIRVYMPLPSSLQAGGLFQPPENLAWKDNQVSLVPHRNAFLLTLGAMAARKQAASILAFGAIDIQGPQYPDTTPTFAKAIEKVFNMLHPDLEVVAPFAGKTKLEVLELARHLGLPIAATFSCHFARDHHCNCCPGCIDRELALSGMTWA